MIYREAFIRDEDLARLDAYVKERMYGLSPEAVVAISSKYRHIRKLFPGMDSVRLGKLLSWYFHTRGDSWIVERSGGHGCGASVYRLSPRRV